MPQDVDAPRHLTVPWPPSLNRAYRAVGKKVKLSKVGRAYLAAVSRALPVGRVPPPLRGRLLVWLTLYPPAKLATTGQPWDIANREKLLMDALTHQRIWLDDAQIDALVIMRGSPAGEGRADLTIHTLQPGGLPL